MRHQGTEYPVVVMKSVKADGAKGICGEAMSVGPTSNGMSLADEAAASRGFHLGSRMSGDAHVRFWESPGV